MYLLDLILYLALASLIVVGLLVLGMLIGQHRRNDNDREDR